jgi:hypothetical protein
MDLSNLSNLFAGETNELKILLSLISINMDDNIFSEYCEDIDEIIQHSYQNDDTDIEDMGDLIMLLNNKIEQLFTDANMIEKFYNLVLLRKKAKKLSHKKFREGYEWIHKDEIKKGIIKSIIKYPDENARNFWNVEECEYQYNALLNYVWLPSSEKLKKFSSNFD